MPTSSAWHAIGHLAGIGEASRVYSHFLAATWRGRQPRRAVRAEAQHTGRQAEIRMADPRCSHCAKLLLQAEAGTSYSAKGSVADKASPAKEKGGRSRRTALGARGRTLQIWPTWRTTIAEALYAAQKSRRMTVCGRFTQVMMFEVVREMRRSDSVHR